MDNSWVNYWRSKVTKTRLLFLGTFVVVILLLVLITGGNTSILISYLPMLFVLGVAFILLSMIIRLKIRIIDTYTICVYSGVITNILIIDGIEYDRCTFSNDYLYGQLPDGRQVCVKQSFLTGNVKITVGKDNEFNVML